MFSILYNPVIGYAERIFAVEIVHDAVSAEPTLRHYIAGIFGIARREDRERVALLIDKAAARYPQNGASEDRCRTTACRAPAPRRQVGRTSHNAIYRHATNSPPSTRPPREATLHRAILRSAIDVALGYTVDAVNAGRRRTQHYLAAVVAQRQHVAMYRHLAI